MDAKLTSEEYAQILQTIEMFEVISQAEPGDCQSYDILKEAYLKIGQVEAALQVSRKLAEAYLHMGLYSSALLECEGILQQQPGSPDIVALVDEIQSRIQTRGNGSGTHAGEPRHHPNGSDGEPGVLDLDAGDRPAATVDQIDEEEASLIAIGTTKRAPGQGPSATSADEALAADDGNEHFARFLSHHQIFPEAQVHDALHRVRERNAPENLAGNQTMAVSLLDEVTKLSGQEVDQMLSRLIDLTRFGYIPLECYDIDRAIVRLLPEKITLQRLIVPFDIVSRTVMIALCNPFDSAAKEAIQAQLDYHIQWYLAKPAAVTRVLRDVYRLDARD